MGSTGAGVPTDYAERVLDVVERIPAGRVMAYGDVAAALGSGAARVVGGVLARWGGGVPWHRVLRADGTPAAHLRDRQLALLRAEGTPLRDGRVDMAAARWDPRWADPRWRPAAAELASAYGRTVPDLVAPGLRVLLVGINPGLWSGLVGLHFARPSNRLWPTLHRSGWTPRQLHPAETGALLAAGVGVTNLVDRATARADEVSAGELRAGVPKVAALARRWRPAWAAVLGLTAYRTAFRCPGAVVGAQDGDVGGRPVWLLPNPSGLNAAYPLGALVGAYAALRRATMGEG